MPVNSAFDFDSEAEKYIKNSEHGHGSVGATFFLKRESPYLITAPHSVVVPRWNGEPLGDRLTGPLAEQIALNLGASVLTFVGSPAEPRAWSLRTDQGLDGQDKDEFQSIIEASVAKGAVVVDIHGMSDSHGIDVCIGRGPNPSKFVRDLAENLRLSLADEFTVSIDIPFSAKGDHTVTRFVQDVLKGDAIQIESSWDVRRTSHGRNEFVSILAKVLSNTRVLP